MSGRSTARWPRDHLRRESDRDVDAEGVHRVLQAREGAHV